MVFGYFSKNKIVLLIILVIILILGIFVFFYSPIIFQEGNPWPQIKGVAQLTFGNKDIVKLDSGGNKYISKSDNPEVIKSFMRDKGYNFTEQMGSGYFFTKDNLGEAVVTHKYYSRFYSLWNITEKNSPQAIFSGTFVCLPVKDINLSHNDICLFGLQDEKGNYYRLHNSDGNFSILGTINVGTKILVEGVLVLGIDDIYQSLGTIIVKRVTQQNFMGETNSDWDIILAVLNNCEVESVFQNHNKLVTLKLKNGNKVTAHEPQIDDVVKVVESLYSKCGDIRLATE